MNSWYESDAAIGAGVCCSECELWLDESDSVTYIDTIDGYYCTQCWGSLDKEDKFYLLGGV